MKGDDKIMKYALVIAKTSSDEEDKAVTSYGYDIEHAKLQTLGVSKINTGVHLCSLEHGLFGLLRILTEAKGRNIHVQVLFSEKEFPFVHS